MVIKIGSIYKIDGSYKNNGRKESRDTDEHINDLMDWFSEMTHKQFRTIKKRQERIQKSEIQPCIYDQLIFNKKNAIKLEGRLSG